MTEAPLKFVALLGSLRRESHHAAIVRALPTLAPPGVTIAVLPSVGDYPHYDADLQAEGFPDVVRESARQIAEADAVILVTPEYNYSVPGAFKNALDWLSRCDPQPFVGKPVAIQTASPGMIGGARAQYHLRQVLVFLDALVLNKPEVMIGQVAEKVVGGTLVDEKTREFLSGQMEALRRMVTRR